MVHIPELKELRITKEEGLTKHNIDKVIDVLLDTPKEQFGLDKYSLNKLELLEFYYKARAILTGQTNITRVWFEINCYIESDQELEKDAWQLVRE